MATTADDLRLILGDLVRPAEGQLRLERDRPYTLTEVDGAADEGSEYWECEEGVIVVNAPPDPRHQAMLTGFMRAWLPAVPASGGLIVMTAPQRVVLNDTTWVEPDLAIWHRDPDLSGGTTGPPILVVEIASRSTRRADESTKRTTYAQADVEWYLLADWRSPPSVAVDHLEGGRYQPHGRAERDQSVSCPVTGVALVPSVLAAG
jgi:Uma2 family endonuclease